MSLVTKGATILKLLFLILVILPAPSKSFLVSPPPVRRGFAISSSLREGEHARLRDESAGLREEITGVESFDKAWAKAWNDKERIRCPFWRRRAVDALEAALVVGRFVLARHKSLNLSPAAETGEKKPMSSAAEALEVIRNDFLERRYYVTGRLSKAIYSNDCFFDAPDPDMPVRGLRKYVDATSHLFEPKSSSIDLLSIETVDDSAVLARWRLEATLMLPWRPSVKAYTGVTLYELNEEGLVSRHTELWSITAADAFISTLFPNWYEEQQHTRCW
ncbi:hypothetical protein GUITHDRAFT_90543 [Guillardia theta CCMP2712]|uniref:SnoaL-like domain-containing protein n=2 Tax=Guillardia theta TaxID=55529 RepID=L1IE71_GUITC|nr:hypothetical protein GUITHDRAFT_90543 [Guillardia theta CCMP2712]EKX34199.1 hypothetical protein GUITHDRAFT_90543 [Guillardia theta CCMP2712]|mmetsp:Transcript_35952/g.112429  ORF Transcript_35952/g.112429 Transcript_35952/m.112429 type:complete len:276 (+) Transcript_35952:295-1122(+)|eukprot:XP_005821179.1 hypothetical protein GUITHDRAFT_90543 [Guillardia theta CCMP2712]